MNANLCAVTSCLAAQIQSNAELASSISGWSAERILAKTGIAERRIAAPNETAGDLAYEAARQLLDRHSLAARIDTLIFCTQSPDYCLPTTACILQDRLQLPRSCAAFDVNLGCSGYTYGLWLARALIRSDSAKNVLLLAGDTYSKYCNPRDPATASLFGDGASASWISSDPVEPAWAAIGPSVLGTDGRGGPHLMLRAGGRRMPEPQADADQYLFMNGAEIAGFAVSTVKAAIQSLLELSHLEWADIDWFVFHQANPAFVRRLADAYRLPHSKVPVESSAIGNTCSATIPITLERCVARGDFQPGQRLVLVGFGVGYSWAATLLEWRG